MKYIFLILSLFLFVSGYDRNKVYKYAEKHWNHYNPKYYNYNLMTGDCANFVSQCIIAGGINLKKICPNEAYGVGGTVPNEVNLGNCLKRNGWTVSSTVPKNFDKGDVVIYPGHAVIAISGYPKVTVAGHNKDRFGDLATYRTGATYYHYNDGKSRPSTDNPQSDTSCKKTCLNKRCVKDVANDVVNGKFGSGDVRIRRLRLLGCDYRLVQDEVNKMFN